SEEHTSELQSLTNLVCRLLLEKKKKHGSGNVCRTVDALIVHMSGNGHHKERSDSHTCERAPPADRHGRPAQSARSVSVPTAPRSASVCSAAASLAPQRSSLTARWSLRPPHLAM